MNSGQRGPHKVARRCAEHTRSRTITSVEQLAAAGLIGTDEIAALRPVSERYAVALTPHIADLIDTNDDPIARQFIPSLAELRNTPEQRADPIGDERHSPVKGIVHRYPDRVLLKLTLVCPVYCRFCFRREMVGPGAGQMLSAAETDAALAYIAAHPEIWEVILTGGDPLMLSARRLREVTHRLNAVPHVKIIRWHTRVPIADPLRVTDSIVDAMKSAATAYVVIHVNHAKELCGAAITAIAKIVDAGVPVLSQTVLLKGINDNVPALEALARALIAARVKPYYLHHMDLAPGTEHFRTTITEGRALYAELRRAVSGIAVPHYVLDIPGGFAKAQLSDSDVQLSRNSARLRDNDSTWHDYREG